MSIEQQVQELFTKHFDGSPQYIVRAPGRVNLIGEHTDYNEGFVFPIAIHRAVFLAFSPNQTADVNIVAANFSEESFSFSLDTIEKKEKGWLEYVKGVAYELQQLHGQGLKCFNAVVMSDVPIGAGLSSSAALELAVAHALCEVNGIAWQPVEMAQLAQRAENNWVGVNCGIMDQLISAVGREDHAVLIDCRDLSYEEISLPNNIDIVVLDTATRRGLVESAYNERRMQCEQASKALGVSALRDASIEQLEQANLNELVFKRAHHVISECNRTLDAKKAMLANDPVWLGKLFNESHQSLRDDFAVTNEALDVMVELATEHPACYGARMTGAGFGGCAVALVDEAYVEKFCGVVAEQYQSKMNLSPNLYPVFASHGTAL